VEGLNEKTKADRRKEEAFVRGETDKADDEKLKPPNRKTEQKQKPKEKREGEEQAPATPPPPMAAPAGRMPLTTRIRSDLATALTRASLKRKLAGEKPNTIQDILEEALEPWLKDKGYLKT
jgi:hypothetical protein